MDRLYPENMAEKNARSFAAVVKTYSNQLMHFVKARVSKAVDAEDILQEVWYQFSRISDIDGLENTGAWLYSVTRNKITDNYRKKKNDSLEDLTAAKDEEDFSLEHLLVADDSNNPELKIFKDIFWDELMKALAELPENQRTVYIRNEIEEMTLKEIALQDGVNLKTVISRKGYAVKHLRLRMRALYEELNY
ncbi:RNA polymerase sigma factor [Sphingobacterium sp. JB170]|uniref:RNA polymerase sigma factor n=1 Tax=Sphingobacterium sp. JB170 TaxID=1434842 RepID=UPI000B353BB8|nr:sigma-70 family RNA polymerase sigma factor [Sphingobacterium sp. JB170]